MFMFPCCTAIYLPYLQDYEKKQRAIPLLREEVQKLKNRIESADANHEKAKSKLAEVLPEYGKLKDRLYDVTRQHQQAKQDRENLGNKKKRFFKRQANAHRV